MLIYLHASMTSYFHALYFSLDMGTINEVLALDQESASKSAEDRTEQNKEKYNKQ